MKKKYFIGRGLEVNRRRELSCAHCYLKPGNLYLLRNKVGIEKFDWLYASSVINETKYFRILLYEWFLVIKNGGFLILELTDNQILDYSGLKKEISLTPRFSGSKTVEDRAAKGKRLLVLQKVRSDENENDNIDKWTIGIATNGKRKDFLRRSIASIRNLKIPQYEIVICGSFFDSVEKDMKLIPFTENDDRGWITKKKNLICENSKFENIVVIHDRIFFDKNWLLGMKKWGNNFEVLSCPVMMPKGSPVNYTNWEAVDESWKQDDDYRIFHSNAGLDKTDWSYTAYVGGPFIAIKKSIWNLEKWNEELFWGDAEDIEYSLRQQKSGILIRFNPYALVHSQSISGVFIKAMYEKDTQKMGRYKSSKPLAYGFKFLDLLGLRRNQKAVLWATKKLKRMAGVADWRMRKSSNNK